jgi:hypothetical protein
MEFHFLPTPKKERAKLLWVAGFDEGKEKQEWLRNAGQVE